MTLDRAGDSRDGIGAERGATLDVEAVDGLEEREGRDLFEILERLAAAVIAAGQAAGEREVALDELLAEMGIAGSPIGAEQPLLIEAPLWRGRAHATASTTIVASSSSGSAQQSVTAV